MRRDDKRHQPNTRDERGNARRPYDSREIERLPRATDEGPPYRPWWILDAHSSEGTDPQA
jgi:hypothetical protein